MLRGMWHLPGPGIKPMSSASAGGFFTTAGSPFYIERDQPPKVGSAVHGHLAVTWQSRILAQL